MSGRKRSEVDSTSTTSDNDVLAKAPRLINENNRVSRSTDEYPDANAGENSKDEQPGAANHDVEMPVNNAIPEVHVVPLNDVVDDNDDEGFSEGLRAVRRRVLPANIVVGIPAKEEEPKDASSNDDMDDSNSIENNVQ